MALWFYAAKAWRWRTCAEATAFPAEAREMALAHVVRTRAEAAYRRGDQLEKRREIMAAWSGFLNGRV